MNPPPPPPPDESALDESALQTHLERVRRLAYAMLRDSHLADDVAQDTMAAAMAHRVRMGDASRGWFAKVARNFAFQTLRMRTRRAERERAAARPEGLAPGDAAALRAEAFRNVTNAVLALEEPWRTTVILRFFDQLAPREIAQLQGVPVATVHTRLARALEKLKIVLARDARGAGGHWALALAPLFTIPSGGIVASPGPSLLVAAMKAKTVILSTVLIAAAAAVLLFIFNYYEKPDASGAGSVPVDAAAGDRAESRVAAVGPAGGGTAAREEVRAESAPVKKSESAPVKDETVNLLKRVLRGRVIDCDGRAVAGIEVQVLPRQGAVVASAQTDPDGIFIFQNVFNNEDIVTKSDRYTNVFRGSVPAGAGQAEPIVIVAPKLTCAGMVVDAKGNPVELADVHFNLPGDFRSRFQQILDFSSPQSWVVRSGAGGKFEFTDVPEVRGSIFSIQHSGFAPLREPAPSSSTWNLVLKLAPVDHAAGFILGRVIDRDGMAVEKARVGDGENVYKTDKDGYFTIPDSKRKSVKLTAAARGLQPATAELQYSEATGWPDNTILRLGGPALSIAGHLYDPEGKPVKRGKVWIVNGQYWGNDPDNYLFMEGFIAGEGSFGYIVDTDAAGAFELKGLLDRNYTIKAIDGTTHFTIKADAVAAGTRDLVLNILKAPVHARVAGIVMNHAGEPIAGVRVGSSRTTFTFQPSPGFVFSHDEPRPDESMTGADGKFELKNILKSDVMLTFHADHILASTETVGAGDDPENLKIVVAQRCHMKVELASAEDADQFQVLDASGERLGITIIEGSSSSRSTVGRIENGASSLVAVPDTAQTLILLKKGAEVRRVTVKLKPGEPQVVRG